MPLNFNPTFIKTTYFCCFKSKEAFENALDDLLIATPEKAKEHEKLKGISREPQETVPKKNAKGVVISGTRNGNGTVHSKSLGSVEERAEMKSKIMRYIEANKIRVEDMNETIFEFDASEEDGETITPRKASILLTEFLDTMRDFLDFIVPIVTEDENLVDISNVIYSIQLNRLDGRKLVKVIAVNKNELSLLKQLWNVYVEFLRTYGREGKENEKSS